MRFVIADLNGRTHAYFDSRSEVRQALRELESDDPDSIDELYVAAYDEGRRVWGPAPALTVLESADLDWSPGIPGPSLATGTTTLTIPVSPVETHQRAEADRRPPVVPA